MLLQKGLWNSYQEVRAWHGLDFRTTFGAGLLSLVRDEPIAEAL